MYPVVEYCSAWKAPCRGGADRGPAVLRHRVVRGARAAASIRVTAMRAQLDDDVAVGNVPATFSYSCCPRESLLGAELQLSTGLDGYGTYRRFFRLHRHPVGRAPSARKAWPCRNTHSRPE